MDPTVNLNPLEKRDIFCHCREPKSSSSYVQLVQLPTVLKMLKLHFNILSTHLLFDSQVDLELCFQSVKSKWHSNVKIKMNTWNNINHLSATYKILSKNSAVKVNSICRGYYWGSSVWISKQHVNYRSYILHLSNTREKIGLNEAVHQLFVGFKKAYNSVRREVLYNILIESGTPMKLGRLTKCI